MNFACQKLTCGGSHLRWFLSTAVILTISVGPLNAQELALRLKSEDLKALARAAAEKGDAVRGAIVFSQQKLACAACHSPGAQNLLGPDLTKIPADTTDEYLVTAILNPSKAIRKGFDTSTIITTAGKTLSGRVIGKSDPGAEIVLRESSATRRLIRLPADEIDEISVSTKSMMPDGLVDLLKDRQQFLDLVRYMIQLRDSETFDSQPRGNRPASVELADLNPQLQGLVLLNDFHCTACHANDLAATAVPAKTAPDLSWLAGRTHPEFIEKLILDPHRAKPGTRMPGLVSSLPANERQYAVQELLHYVYSTGKSSPGSADSDGQSPSQTKPAEVVVKPGAVTRGRQLFHSVGCIACHSPRDDQEGELLPKDSVSLGSVQAKYHFAGLVDFLEDPHASRPSGRMPNMKLSRWEAIDVASYLMGEDRLVPNEFEVDQRLAKLGQKRFYSLGCSSCHVQNRQAETLGNSRPESVLVSQPQKSLSKLRSNQGCLSGARGDWPHFEFTEQEVSLLRAGLTIANELTSEQDIQVSLSTFGCVKCHERGELGGITDERNHLFLTTNPNLGPQGRIPPDLTGVGAKLQAKWMRQVMVSGKSSRPYVTTRMPQHGAENIEHLVELFQQVDSVAKAKFPEIAGRDQQKTYREAGMKLAGTGGLNCIACHTFQEKPGATMSAIELTEMSERLKPDWFYQYMLSPQSFNRGTVMPSFWPGGRAMRKEILDGKTDGQIAGLWEWMSDGRQARAPRGMVSEPIQLLATDEAVMLRRSWPGIGKRGIGVGYPGQVNLAFDAEQMRIAILWQGKFADPGGVWRSQGHGVAHPLAREQSKFLPGPEFDDANSPWVADDGRPPKHKFKGYVLDKLRRPTFLYNFDDIPVEDSAIDVPKPNGDVVVRRTLTFKPSSARQNLMFRIATEDDIEPSEVRGEFLIGRSLRLRIEGNAGGSSNKFVGTISKLNRGNALRIPFDLTPGETRLVLEYRWK